eukprot:12986404-Heterocapsa_arctica.AAC.1
MRPCRPAACAASVHMQPVRLAGAQRSAKSRTISGALACHRRSPAASLPKATAAAAASAAAAVAAAPNVASLPPAPPRS